MSPCFLEESFFFVRRVESPLAHGSFQIRFSTNPFYAIMWSIWLARNDLIFNGKDTNTLELCTLILHRLSIWMKVLDDGFPFSTTDLLTTSESIRAWTNPIKHRPSISCIAPPLTSIKWNVNGSSLGKPCKSAVGGVLYDSNGKFLCVFSYPVRILDSNAAVYVLF
ncbi:hypothetical protein P3X46_027046 [Hevea brasiliensis]|uniref:RNase H type-1 domain-containing protein n=1 Tax=Hevea brasiliensis TaxID=3981 RepID=A0ABQ9L1T5_HEVBR|nr:hypothetical protein P3X46_027046 [Hevea brasiliensis]